MKDQSLFSLKCGHCGKVLRVSVEHAGKLGKCPACRVPFVIPAPPPSTPCFACAHVPPPASVYCPACGARLNDPQALSYTRLEEKSQKLQEQQQQLKDQLTKVQEQKEQLANSAEELRTRLAQLVQTSERQQAQQAQQTQELQRLQELNRQLEQELAGKQDMVPREKAACLETELLTLLQKLRTQNAALQEQLAARPTPEMLASLEHELKAVERLTTAREEQLSQKLRELEQARQVAEAEQQKLQERLSALTTENQNQAKSLEKLRHKRESLLADKQRLEQERRKLSQENKQLQEQHMRLARENQTLKKELERRANWFPVSTLEDLENRYRGALRTAGQKSRDLQMLTTRARGLEEALAKRRDWVPTEVHAALQQEKEALARKVAELGQINQKLSAHTAELEEALAARADWVPPEEVNTLQEQYRQEHARAQQLAEEIEELRYSLAERGGVIAGCTYRDILRRMHEQSQRCVELTQQLEESRLFAVKRPSQSDLVKKLAIESRRANELANLLTSLKEELAAKGENVVPLLSYQTLQAKFFDEIAKSTQLNLEVEALRRELQDSRSLAAFKELEQNLLEEIRISSALALELEETKRVLAEASRGIPPKEFRALEERLEVEKTRAEALKSELERLRRELAAREAEQRQMQADMQRLVKERDRIKTEYGNEMRDLRRAMEKLASLSDNLEKGLARKSQEVISLKSQINRSSHSLFTLQGMNERLQAEVERLRQKCRPAAWPPSLNAQALSFDQKLQDLYQFWQSLKAEFEDSPQIPPPAQKLSSAPAPELALLSNSQEMVPPPQSQPAEAAELFQEVAPGSFRQIGFDLGTTQTVVAYYQQAPAAFLELGDSRCKDYQRFAVPGVIGYLEREDRFIFGQQAQAMPEKTTGYRKIYAIKRCLMCRGAEYCQNVKNQENYDICSRGQGPWLLGSQGYYTWELLGQFIHYIFGCIQKKYGVDLPPDAIYFTVPPFWNSTARQQLRQAVQAALQAQGWPLPAQIHLVSDVTACALAHLATAQTQRPKDEIFGVLDMGGGTTSLYFFEQRKGRFWMLVGKSTDFGGDNLDECVREIIQRKISRWEFDLTIPAEHKVIAELLQQTAHLRELLSHQEKVEYQLAFAHKKFTLILTQEELEREIEEHLVKVVELVLESYEELQPLLTRFKKHLHTLYLAGGVTRSPAVRRIIAKAMTRLAPKTRLRPLSKYADTAGLSAPQRMLQQDFPLIAAASGAATPSESLQEHLLDRLPYEIGLIQPGTPDTLIPLYQAFESLPKKLTREITLDGAAHHLTVYLRRHQEDMLQSLQYLPLPEQQPKISLQVEISSDFLVIVFTNPQPVREEKISLPPSHPYCVSKDNQPIWTERLSPLMDYQLQLDDKTIWVSGEDTQCYLQQQVHVNDQVRLVQSEQRVFILHQQQVIGFLQAAKTAQLPSLTTSSGTIRWMKADLLFPEDLDANSQIAPVFQPGDLFLVYDLIILPGQGQAPPQESP